MAPSTAVPETLPKPVAKLSKPPVEDEPSLNDHERSTIAFVDKYSAPDVHINGQHGTVW